MNTELRNLIGRIAPPDEAARTATQHQLDNKTKPRRSLGHLEDLACKLAAIRGPLPLDFTRKAVVVLAADHGVAAEGVSAYPQEVTRQMVLNFARGGAAINVLAAQAGAQVVVVDMGTAEPVTAEGVLSRRIGPGTQNMAKGPAMTSEQAVAAITAGATIAADLAAAGVTLIGAGEMGIANTTAASALTSVFTGVPPGEVTGFGTGISADVHRHKVHIVRQALEVNAPNATDPLGAIAKTGGFEIAGLCGVMLGAAAARIPVMLDGFISTAAALAAEAMAPQAGGYFIAAHNSVEMGHRVALRHLGLIPLLDLNLRLGEGTGAALAFPLVDAAIAILQRMATFETAAVTDTGA